MGEIKGPCISCGATNYRLSFGGPGICPACDTDGFCRRCKIFQSQVQMLEDQIESLSQSKGIKK